MGMSIDFEAHFLKKKKYSHEYNLFIFKYKLMAKNITNEIISIHFVFIGKEEEKPSKFIK